MEPEPAAVQHQAARHRDKECGGTKVKSLSRFALV